jgi:hypothetical protein
MTPNLSKFAAYALVSWLTILTSPPAIAGEIEITQAKALAGNVTPGDTPGYPVTISIAGSYRLASNLIVPANQIGIFINRPFVTIDLNGFTMQGSGVAAYGVQGSLNSATIQNGTITGFKLDGISGTGRFWSIEDMRVVGNGGHGIRAGHEAHIRSSTSAENGGHGLACGNLCLVERSTATSNHGDGIVCGLSCHAEGNVASFNGFSGLFIADGLALGNTASRNTSFGIVGDNAFLTTVYESNVLVGNNQGNVQANDVTSLHANFCFPGACP